MTTLKRKDVIQIIFSRPSTSEKSDRVLIFVGGSGDTKDSYRKLVELVKLRLNQYNFCTFSFRKTQNTNPLAQQVKDLMGVCTLLIEDYSMKEIKIFCTSVGAYSTCFILSSYKYSHAIKQVIFCDPADYYVTKKIISVYKTWSGSQKYLSEGKTASDLLKNIDSLTKVDVIHFPLKNYGVGGYIDKKYEDRFKNHPNFYPRLNTEMVKSFYNKLPTINRGIYIEEKDVPHAFNRDGNVRDNLITVARIIEQCINLKNRLNGSTLCK